MRPVSLEAAQPRVEDTHPLILVGAEEPSVVPLLDHYERDPRLVVFF